MKDRFSDLIFQETAKKDRCRKSCTASESSETDTYRLPDERSHRTMKTTFHLPFQVFANSEISDETAAEFHPYWSRDAQAIIAYEILPRRATSASEPVADNNRWANDDLSNLYVV